MPKFAKFRTNLPLRHMSVATPLSKGEYCNLSKFSYTPFWINIKTPVPFFGAAQGKQGVASNGQGAMDPYIAKMIIAETSKPSYLLRRNCQKIFRKAKTLGELPDVASNISSQSAFTSECSCWPAAKSFCARNQTCSKSCWI